MGTRILHLIDSGGLYGAEKMLLSLVEEQVRQGLEPMILSAGEVDISEKPIEAEARKKALPVTTWRMKPGLNLRAGGKIAAWAKANGFEILHSHGYKFNILLGLLSQRQRALKFVSTIHGYTANRLFSKLFVYRALDCLLSYRTDQVVVVNDGLKRLLLARNNVRFIPNGIDANESDPKEPAPPLQCGRFIAVVGRLSMEKAVDRAIAAFAHISDQYPDYSLVIVGDGPEKSKLKKHIKHYGLSERVIFTGYSDVATSYIRNAEALLISSETEGLPLTLLEAMRVGTPVVSTPVGEIPNVLENGRLGYLSSDRTEASLAQALIHLLGDPEQAHEKAKFARDRLLNEYTSEKMSQRYYALYQEVLGK